MNCKECLSIVEEYVENSLEPQTSNQTAAHISACVGCRTIYEELKNEQEIYSRYLLKIKEKPKSWDAVRTEIRKGSSVAAANAGTVGVGFYERFSAIFFRQPLFAGDGRISCHDRRWLWLMVSQLRSEKSSLGVASSRESALNEKKTIAPFPTVPLRRIKPTSQRTSRRY